MASWPTKLVQSDQIPRDRSFYILGVIFFELVHVLCLLINESGAFVSSVCFIAHRAFHFGWLPCFGFVQAKFSVMLT